jgi:hypothetical protein
MSAFKTDSELYYEKSPSDTLSDIEKAFGLIGKDQKIDLEACKIHGETLYGMVIVAIDAKVEVIDGKTKVLFHGKSRGIIALEAKTAGIDNLINTMKNLDNTEYTPSKTGGITSKQNSATMLNLVLVLCSVFMILGIILSGIQPVYMFVLCFILLNFIAYRLRSWAKSMKTK